MPEVELDELTGLQYSALGMFTTHMQIRFLSEAIGPVGADASSELCPRKGGDRALFQSMQKTKPELEGRNGELANFIHIFVG